MKELTIVFRLGTRVTLETFLTYAPSKGWKLINSPYAYFLFQEMSEEARADINEFNSKGVG